MIQSIDENIIIFHRMMFSCIKFRRKTQNIHDYFFEISYEI